MFQFPFFSEPQIEHFFWKVHDTKTNSTEFKTLLGASDSSAQVYLSSLVTPWLKMNNPNHPLYSALGGGSNIHLLDNMLFNTDHNKPILNSQYVYSNMEQLAAHQHVMNLAVSEQSHHVAAAVAAANNAGSTIDTSALLYGHHQNDHHQQQPISYKIPQVNKLAV